MTNRTRLIWTAAALVPLTVLAAACSSSPSSSPSSTPSAAKMIGPALPGSPNKTPQSLTETGSTLLFPLFGTWSEAYQKQFVNSAGAPIVTITTGGTGSGTGITDAATGTVNIGASDAYLSSADLSANPGLLNIPLAISAQEISYNLKGINNLHMNGTVLAEIYSGKVTMWNAPQIKAINPGVSLPAKKIITLHRADSSGDTFLFTSYMNAQDPSAWTASNVNTTVSWPSVPGALAETGNSGMVAGCAANPGCIAYIGISYLSKTQAAGLGTAALGNKAGKYISPTPATIAAAADALTAKTPANGTLSMINGPASGGYPIVNYEYAIVKTKQSSGIVAEDIRAFLHWIVHTGQSPTLYLDAVNFVKLPGHVVSQSDAQISKIGS